MENNQQLNFSRMHRIDVCERILLPLKLSMGLDDEDIYCFKKDQEGTDFINC